MSGGRRPADILVVGAASGRTFLVVFVQKLMLFVHNCIMFVLFLYFVEMPGSAGVFPDVFFLYFQSNVQN